MVRQFSGFMERFEYFEHTADMKYRAYGKTLDEAFGNALLAMTNFLTPVDAVMAKLEKEVVISAQRLDSLLFDFLEEFIFFMDTEGFLASRIISLTVESDSEQYTLIARVAGDHYGGYPLKCDIKAATYNEMEIAENNGRWTVQVVLDI